MDEGYIKFQPIWQKTPAYSGQAVTELIRWRQACFERKWIGQYDNGIGYGNLSLRAEADRGFYITGSATGGISELSSQAIAKVTQVRATENRLWCSGPVIASSESMSHAALYEELPWVGGVIHIHHAALWRAALHHIPTTAATAPYGTPAMVESIVDLLRESNLKEEQVFVMEGHEGGIFAFGEDLASAFRLLDATFTQFRIPA